MPDLTRYIIIAIGIVALALVLTVCGDGACSECVHACCSGSDRGDRLRALVGRLLAVGDDAGGHARLAPVHLALASKPSSVSVLAAAPGVSFLRI